VKNKWGGAQMECELEGEQLRPTQRMAIDCFYEDRAIGRTILLLFLYKIQNQASPLST
jgi:hypothetical protein